MSRPHILSIDLGTSSVKVALVDCDGRVAAAAVQPVPTFYPAPGAAEQDPRQIWQAICDATAAAMAAASGAADQVVGITCASQYFSVLPVDDAGHALGNLILWHDERGGPHCRALYEKHPQAVGRWLATTGFLPVPSGSDSLSHTLYIQAAEPEIYARAACFLEPADFIVARLSGRCTTNPCTAFAQLLTDNRDLEHVRYADDLVAMSGIDRDKLPELVPTGACVGTLCAAAAADLGLPPATPVFAGVNDTQAVSIGTATHVAGRAAINVGTTCQVIAFLDSLRTDLGNNLFAMPSPLAHAYSLMAENGLGGRLVEFFLRNIAFAGDALADHRRDDPYGGFEAALASARPACGGLLFLPWLNGAQTPDPNPAMRGGFLNMSLETTRAEMLRAVVEGVTFNLLCQVAAAERLCGSSFAELRFAGGGALSGQWAQTVADIMDRPVRPMADPRHTNNRATAFLGFAKLGLVSLDQADEFFPTEAVVEPRREHRLSYDRLFAQYQASYERVRPICEALSGDGSGGSWLK